MPPRCIKLSKFFLYFVVLILYGFGILLFYEKGKPIVRGFYCHDNSINQPFREGTVSFKAVLFITFVVALICFVIVEFLKSRENSADLNSITNLITNRTLVTRVLVLCFLLLNATVTTVFITDIGKYTVGRLRPNYLSICEPNWSKINCTTVHGLQQAIYGDDYCKTTNLKKLKAARLSFPSGHASLSSCAATFLVLYIGKYLQYSDIWVILSKVFIQVVIACLAIYTSLTRISDNKQHPSDVLAGMILGIVTGYIFGYSLESKIICVNRSQDKGGQEKISKAKKMKHSKDSLVLVEESDTLLKPRIVCETPI